MIEIYSFGYKDKRFSKFAEMLQREKVDAVIDTRYNPNCFDSFWNIKNLKSSLPLYNIKYFSFLEFGNVNYRNLEEERVIKDMPSGLKKLNDVIKNNDLKKICMICVCACYETCHSKIVIDRIIEDENFIFKGRL